MAIQIRNRPSDADRYRVVDVKITGVDYSSLTNRTTVTVDPTDTNHNYVEPGYYMVPQRNDNSPRQIVHPLNALKIISKITETNNRQLILEGNQLSTSDASPGGGFFQHNSPALTTAGFDSPYTTTAFTTDNVQRNRKYRIVTLGNTVWEKFGDLYRSSQNPSYGKEEAKVGVTFSANASGSGGDDPQTPLFFDPSTGANRPVAAGGTRYHNNPLAGYQIFGLTGDLAQVNGVYDYVSSELFKHITNNIFLEKRTQTDGGVGRWTIYNPGTNEIFFEHQSSNSSGFTLDSPVSSSPQVVFEDRTATVVASDQGNGTVVEVGWFSNVITDEQPLTNAELDSNFLDLERNKLTSDGSMAITGDQVVRGKVDAEDLDISGAINLDGSFASGTNTFLNAGTKDIECNNLILTGEIDDVTLFRKYKVTSFPHSFLAYYNVATKNLEPTTALFFVDVGPFSVSNVIRDDSDGKKFYVRRVNTEFNYILVSEVTSNSTFKVGNTVTDHAAAGAILKVLDPKNYLSANQNLKIFGLQQRALAGYVDSVGAITMNDPDDTFTVSKLTDGVISPATTSYAYKIALMDKRTGKISNITVANSSRHVVQGQVAVDLMNNSNYNKINGVNRADVNNIILLYRQVNGAGNFDLINIYDDSDIGTSTTNIELQDYGLYNKTEWGVYTATNGKYNQRLNPIYIPLSDAERNAANSIQGVRTDVIGLAGVGNSNKYSKGFLETTVAGDVVLTTDTSALNHSPSVFKIQETQYNASPNIDETGFDSPLIVGQHQKSDTVGTDLARANNVVEFFIDNGRVLNHQGTQIVGGFQKLIDDAQASGLNKIDLRGGTYYSKLITVPSNFKFEGNSRTNTFIKSLPWNFTNTKNFKGGNTYTGYTSSPKSDVLYFNETTTGNINTEGTISRFAEITPAQREPTTSGVFSKVIRNREAYGRVLLDADGRSNVQVSNITLDGSFESNTIDVFSTTGKGNFVFTAERSNDIFLDNVTIKNGTTSGIFFEHTNSSSINNAIVRDGGNLITTNTFATGLYAPEAKRLRMQSSLIENFSNANDLTTNSNTSLVGNIIRNTGSGVLAFASSNFNKGSNLVLGPADEFIPMVDTLNSEYDELNVNLLEIGDYLSDIVEFRRDGAALNLGKPVDVNNYGVSFDSKINTLVELGTNQYFINQSAFDFTNGSPGTTVPVISVPTQNSPDSSDPTAAALSSGNFQLKITSRAAERLRANASFDQILTQYRALTNRPSGEALVGLIFQVMGSEFTFLDGNDQALLIKAYSVNSGGTATFTIDSKFAGLISVDDQIVFKFGIAAQGGLQSYSTSGTDLLGNPKVRSYPVTQVTTTTAQTDITVDLSDHPGTLTSVTGIVDGLPDNNTRLGIKNTFTIAKGRIII